jgi:hypothetical protein
MRYIIFVISAYFTGVLAAVPAGPVQLEVVRRSINGHIRSALMVVLGALIVDIFYGLIAFFGIAPYLKRYHGYPQQQRQNTHEACARIPWKEKVGISRWSVSVGNQPHDDSLVARRSKALC